MNFGGYIENVRHYSLKSYWKNKQQMKMLLKTLHYSKEYVQWCNDSLNIFFEMQKYNKKYININTSCEYHL